MIIIKKVNDSIIDGDLSPFAKAESMYVEEIYYTEASIYFYYTITSLDNTIHNFIFCPFQFHNPFTNQRIYFICDYTINFHHQLSPEQAPC